MDWGMITFYRTGKVQLRQRSYFHWTFYVVLLIINFILRFSWKANRISWLRALHSSHLVLVLEVAEVCRRALWNVVRVEWEVIVQQEKKIESVHPGTMEEVEENKGGRK